MDETKQIDPEEFNFINELGRKTVHLFVWVIPLSYHWLKFDLWFIQLALFGSLCIFITLEVYRLLNPESWIQVYVYKYITRASEKEGPANYVLTTTVWLVLLLGVGVDFSGVTWKGLYSMEIAELVLVSTVMGDSAAALVGKAIGRVRLPLTKNKTVEGFMGGVITNYLVGSAFLLLVGLPSLILPIIPTIVWCCFDFFEDLPWYLADNLFSPPIAAVIIAVLEIIL